MPLQTTTASRPWALLGATGFALGVGLPLGKQAVAHAASPLAFALWPALSTIVVLGALAWRRHGAPVALAPLLRFGLLAGLLGGALPSSLSAWVAAQAGASITAFAYTLPPLFTLGLMVLLGFEPLRWQRLAAVALAFSGALWLASTRVSAGVLSMEAAIGLLAIPLSLAGGNVFRARRLPPGVPAEWLGVATAAGAAAMLLPAWVATGAPAVPAAAWPYTAAQMAAAPLAMLLFFRLQQRADAMTMSFIGYAMALCAALLGTLLLGERLPWQLLPAVVLIGTGFWWMQRTAPMPLVPRTTHH
ncbi:DMT family transporter [Ideonella sp. BN130291]|uniref:DMT family transporter n=1 Tax=Ideonella sp. BN130291 TaxID=3112940 RepID=UPI002E27114D|nr:DMT family transporter [Ideonella sp. BN130291]